MNIKLKLNGMPVEFDAEPNTRLLEILRTRFSMSSTKCSCLQGFCGACMVLLDDEPVTSCMIPICNVDGHEVETLEHFSRSKDSEYKRIMAAFKKANVKMCGYCDAGKIFTAYKIIKMKEAPDEKKIREMFEGQLCRCSVADSLVEAIEKLR